MFKFKIYPLIVLMSLAIISCEKNNDNNDDDNNNSSNAEKVKMLTGVKMTTPLSVNTIDVSWDSKLNIAKTVEKENGSIESVKKYTYNGNLLVDCKWYSDEAMTNQTGSNTYTVNAAGEITKMVEIDGADTTTYTITWNNGKIAEYTAVNQMAPFDDSRHLFEWNGDNISKETYYLRDSTGSLVLAGYDVYFYDDKINPLTIRYIPEIEGAEFFNKNNILKTEHYNAAGTIQGLTKFTYTYDKDGYPVSGTFDYGYISGQTTYTYSELEKQ